MYSIVNLKNIRIELQQLALELERVEEKKSAVPDTIINSLQNVLQDLKFIK